MATDREQWADSLSADTSGGWLTGFLADEDEFDRRSLWRLGSWGVGSVAAVVVAVLANQHGMNLRRDQFAAADVVRQSQQIQLVARESQNEARRLASAIETLNRDRDRLYTRVTVLEQGLDSVTGAIGQQAAAAGPPAATPGPAVSASSAPQGPPEVPTVSPAGVSLPAIPSSSAAAQSSAPVPAMPATTTAALAPKPAQKADKAVSEKAVNDKAVNDKTVADKAVPEKPAPEKAADKPAVDKPTAEKPAAEKPKTEKPGAIVALAADPPAAAPPAPATRPEPANTAAAAAIAAPPSPMTPLMPSKSIMAPPDPAATKLAEPEVPGGAVPALPPTQDVALLPASVEPEPAAAPVPVIAVQRTEFGIDLGGANSVDGLRALWRGLLKYRANKALAELRPIIVVKERSSSGMGMQLRLVAGPLSDAATAAKICATLTESDRTCETTVFDGQRLALKGDTTPAPAVQTAKPSPAPTRSYRRRSGGKGARVEEPAPKDTAKPEPSRPSLSSMLGLR